MAGPHKPPFGSRDPRLLRSQAQKPRPTPPPPEPELEEEEESAMPERTIVAPIAPIEAFPPKPKASDSSPQLRRPEVPQRTRPTPSRPEPKVETPVPEASPSAAMAAAAASASPSGPTAGELQKLRDILFGDQTRAAEQRLTDVEKGLDALREELTGSLAKEIEALGTRVRDEIGALSDQLGEARDEQSKVAESIRTELEEQLSSARDETDRLRGALERANAKIEKLESELDNKVQEANERSAELQQALGTLATEVEEKTVSRHELGHLLQDLGQRVRGKGPNGRS